MLPDEIRIKSYVKATLSLISELKPYLKEASILWIENDPGLVWDIMVFLPDNLFSSFARRYGECFVVDDHEHSPWVFTRIKSFEWLNNDFGGRLPIALWIYQNAPVLQDPEGNFGRVLREHTKAFIKAVPDILRRKYLEFRTERHNLRHSLERQDKIATAIIKATVTKLAFEMTFLVKGKPYPYKKWLSRVLQQEGREEMEVLKVSEDFLNAEEAEHIIDLSDQLVGKVATLLSTTGQFSEDFLQRWWLYLA